MEHINYLLDLYRKGGPDPCDYDQVSKSFIGIMDAVRSGEISKDMWCNLADNLGDAFSIETTQGFVMQKPHGYAGDFEVIDRIYNCYTSPKKHLEKWDLYSHSRPCTQAVRNRKDYFIRMVENQLKVADNSKPFKVLNIGSGPGRDVKEFFDTHYVPNLTIDCLDQELKAIAYAKEVCSEHLNQVNFIAGNVFRYKPTERYNVVWSAGLFDYLNERAFKFLLQRICTFTTPGGEIVIGNYSPSNPDQDYMAFADWHLIHRTPEELIKLVDDAGILYENISVNSEEVGVNLFVHIQSPYLSVKKKKEHGKVQQSQNVQQEMKQILSEKK